MGNKCFRPVNDNNQPVYISSLNLSFKQADKILQEKKLQNINLIEHIQTNQNRKGYLKKLFDHLTSHERNIFASIKYCNKVISQQKKVSSVVVGNLFCKKLVNLVTNKKRRIVAINTQQNMSKAMISTKNIVKNQFDFRNLLHQLQGHFFQLITKILVYNKEKQIQNSVSQTLIEYANAFQQNLTSKKQLIGLLDLYLTIIFQKNIHMINKNSYLPFYAYSSLLSKSKTQLFTQDFIEKHFNFILKLFFQLQDCKQSNKTLIQSQDFSVFQQCVQSIVKQFILFSTQNRKIKDKILTQIMNQQDIQKFNILKTQKLQKIIKYNLSTYNRQHFMFDWLGYLIKYISKKYLYQNQNYKDSYRDSAFQSQLNNTSNKLIVSCKNINTLESRLNCLQTLKRWFNEGLINIQKTLQYFSERIFQVLLVNLYNPNGNFQQLSAKSQQVLEQVLELKPKKIGELLCLINKKIRKNKNQIFSVQNSFTTNNKSFHLNARKRSYDFLQVEAVQVIWEIDLSFLIKSSKSQNFDDIFLSQEQIEYIYSPIVKPYKISYNIIYLIQLAGVSMSYVDLNNQDVQRQIYSFLISFSNALKIPEQQIQIQFWQNLIKKMKLCFKQMNKKNALLLYSFLKHNFKNLMINKNQLWVCIFIAIVVINQVFQEKQHNTTKRYNKLQQLLEQATDIVKKTHFKSTQIYQLIQGKQAYLLHSQKYQDHEKAIKLKDLQKLQNNIAAQGVPKSVPQIQNSVISSKMQFSSQQNQDNQFKKVMAIVTSS